MVNIMPVSPETPSSYLHDLPAIFSEDPFLGRFLLAFEQVLTGVEGSETPPQKSLEEILANIAKLFNPLEIREIVADIAKLSTPPSGEAFEFLEIEKEFLQWLAGWTALSLRADWTPEQQRAFLANIVRLYRFRGTKDNLVELLKIYTGGLDVNVIEPKDTPFQIRKPLVIGFNTQIPLQIGEEPLVIGVNTQIGGAIPHYFRVEVKLPYPDRELLERQYKIVSALVDLQKPAHTYYDLTLLYETIQIGNPERSILGKNMLIGNLKTYTNYETIQIGNPERSVIGKNMLIGNLKTYTNLEENNG